MTEQELDKIVNTRLEKFWEQNTEVVEMKYLAWAMDFLIKAERFLENLTKRENKI